MRRPRLGLSHPTPPTEIIGRRRFVAWVGGVLFLSACDRSPQAILDASTEPGIGRPLPLELGAFVSAKDFGAQGDGVADDTSALNAAIASLGSDGGTLWVPAGNYLVDPSISIRLTNNVTLKLDADATLRATPVVTGNSSIVLATGARNVAVFGGKIIGERVGHLGTTGEWGMGIRMMGCSNVRIENVQVSDCWGDGIYVGAVGPGKESQAVSITKCTSRNNRRQGLSITGCLGATIRDCEFTDTHGTSPESGIDLEPNPLLRVDDVVIENCLLARNAGFGLILNGPQVTNGRFTANEILENGVAGAAFTYGANQCGLTDNRIERNGENGVWLHAVFGNEVSRNTIQNNSLNAPGRHPNVYLTGSSAHNTMADNRFGHLKRLFAAPLPDIVATPDCHDNSMETTTASSTVSAKRA